MLSATKAFSQNRLFVINVCLLSVFFEHFYFVWEKCSDLRVGLRVKLLPMAVKVSLCALYKVNQFQKNWRRSKSTPLLRIFTYHCAFKNLSHSSGSLFLFGVFADEGTRILFELPCRIFSCIWEASEFSMKANQLNVPTISVPLRLLFRTLRTLSIPSQKPVCVVI